jgi:predicted DNA-binding transcriptional regulator AlpA
MNKSKLLKIDELACLLRTSASSINNDIYKGYEGQTIPFSIRLGKRRLWRPETVDAFLEHKEIENKSICFQNCDEVKSQASIKRL